VKDVLVKRSLLICAAVLACLAVSATPCLAAETSVTASSTAPIVKTLTSTDVQWWMEGEPGKAIAIVSTQLEPGIKLPVRVRLPIPPGMTVAWAGEISGSSVEQDVQRDFTVGTAGGGSYAEFELSQYRIGQIDLSGVPLEADGPTISMNLEYVQSIPSSSTAVTVRLPSGATDVRIDPAPQGAPRTNTDGEALYALEPVRLKTGDSLTTSIDYVPLGAQALPEVGRVSRTEGLLFVLASLAAIAAIVLGAAILRQKRAAALGDNSAVHDEQMRGEPHQDRDRSPRPEPDSDEPFLLDD